MSEATRIILIHGIGCDRTDWSGQMRGLAQVTKVTAPDLPGHGEAGPAEEGSIREMAEAVNRLRRNSASMVRTILVGHSMGCRVGLEATRLAPEGIAGLVLIDGSLQVSGDPSDALRRHHARSADENAESLRRSFAGMFSAATPACFRRSALRRIETIDRDLAMRLMGDMIRWDGLEAPLALRATTVPLLAI